MIAILTGNYRGGIVQFARQIEEELKKIGKETVLFLPTNSESIVSEEHTYVRKNSLNPYTKYYKKIADEILALKPELIFVCDSNLVTARIVLEIDRSIPIYMCVHDAKAHPNYKAVGQYIKDLIKKPYINSAWKIAEKIVLMSEHTKKQFSKMHPSISTKLDIIRLGAHPPKGVERRPEEIRHNRAYFLFFGRIDKYKGIGNLLEAYTQNIDKKPYELVIAGEGVLTDLEREMIMSYPNKITLINRYISNEEMLWLFRHARCVVLPYIEASQSGVLSMAYYFEKPVIASDLEGLKEFIDVGKTGLVYENQKHFEICLNEIDCLLPADALDIKEFVNRNLNWSVNIQRCLREFL